MGFFKLLPFSRGPSNRKFPQKRFIAAIRQGGAAMERATSHLIDHYQGLAFRFSKQFGLEKDVAIDAYTDAVMAVISYIRIGKFDEQYSLSTYLYRLTRNKCIDHLRASQRGLQLSPDPVPEIPISDHKRSALHELLLSEVYHNVLDALEQFKGLCKEIILKWGYWGYSMDEIASALNYRNAEVVKSRKSQCLRRLKACIAANPEFPLPNFD